MSTVVPAAPLITGAQPWWKRWDPDTVYLVDPTVEDSWKTCVLQGVFFGESTYNGSIGGRIVAVFVILLCSFLCTLFPIVAKKIKWLRIHPALYTICKCFGTGVIVATAFIHLIDPAYSEIGPQSCVGSTGNWSIYSWCPAIMLTSATVTFVIDVYCSYFAESLFGEGQHGDHMEEVLRHNGGDVHLHDDDAGGSPHDHRHDAKNGAAKKDLESDVDTTNSQVVDCDFYGQFAGFLVLEFGILFHSVMIGLTLGTTDNYGTLFVVVVFHQSFEGLGIGARMSMIPFPKHLQWLPYTLALAYGLCTPVAIAIGLGVRETYRDDGYTAQLVAGVLDAISAGILLFTGMVELLARDFLFNPYRTKNVWWLSSQLFFVLLGAGLMALLGKWA